MECHVHSEGRKQSPLKILHYIVSFVNLKLNSLDYISIKCTSSQCVRSLKQCVIPLSVCAGADDEAPVSLHLGEVVLGLAAVPRALSQDDVRQQSDRFGLQRCFILQT